MKERKEAKYRQTLVLHVLWLAGSPTGGLSFCWHEPGFINLSKKKALETMARARVFANKNAQKH